MAPASPSLGGGSVRHLVAYGCLWVFHQTRERQVQMQVYREMASKHQPTKNKILSVQEVWGGNLSSSVLHAMGAPTCNSVSFTPKHV